jgi:hypothetical protein
MALAYTLLSRSMGSSKGFAGGPVEDGKERGPHFSQVVAPVLAAFTLPTIALIVTSHPPPHWGNIILALFVASTGLLLASFQLAVGRLFRDTPGWGALRAVLAGLGLILLGAGLYLLVLQWDEGAAPGVPYAGKRAILYVGLAVLAAGVIIPILMNLWLYAERSIDALRKIRHNIADKVNMLRWVYPSLEDERIEKKATKVKLEYYAKNPSAVDIDKVFSKGSDDRACQLKRMQVYPSAGDLNYIMNVICRSRSALEQDQALRAAIRLLPDLGDRDSTRLAAAVQFFSLLND